MSSYAERLAAYVEGQDPLAMQREMPSLIAQAIAGRSAEELRARPRPEKWSVVEIIAHLADDELVAAWRYRQMLESSGCALAAFDQDKWAEFGAYRAWDAEDALALFRLLRQANLRMLERLSAEEWERFGVHSERGRMTVRDLARHMAGHDRNHVEQIEAILGADAAGSDRSAEGY